MRKSLRNAFCCPDLRRNAELETSLSESSFRNTEAPEGHLIRLSVKKSGVQFGRFRAQTRRAHERITSDTNSRRNAVTRYLHSQSVCHQRRVRRQASQRLPFRGARRSLKTFRLRFSTVASVTPMCISPVTILPIRFQLLIPACPATRLSDAWVKTGTAVTKFKEGDLAGVGCMVDSDRTCESCLEGEGSSIARACLVLTYNMPDKHLGGVTYGGYSQKCCR